MCILPFFSQYFVLPPVFSPPAWLFAPHLSCICLISTALLPEFLPAGSPLHTCRASPSLALPSLQCLYLHLIPSLIYVAFKSSLLFSHCRGICVVTVLLLLCFPDVPSCFPVPGIAMILIITSSTALPARRLSDSAPPSLLVTNNHVHVGRTLDGRRFQNLA